MWSFFSTNIPDHTRSISGLVVSPLGNLAAMADKLGRGVTARGGDYGSQENMER